MRKLLLIEDDRIISSIYQRKFTSDGFQVQLAPDGERGIELIQSFHPDIVVLDIMLPKVNGLEVLRTVRANPELAALPVIVFSNAYQTRIIDEAWQLGASMVLMKANTNPKKLSETVEELFAASREGTGLVDAGSMPSAAEAADGGMDQEEQRRLFFDSLPRLKENFRELHQSFLNTNNKSERNGYLAELHRQMHVLTGTAGLVGQDILARMAETYEALLKEMSEKGSAVTVSTTRTSTQTLQFLNWLIDRAEKLPPLENFDPKVMAVDDEEISRRSAIYGLEKAGLHGTAIEHGAPAFMRARETHFDLFVLDVDMPGLTGYELCARLRTLPTYKDTPIIFVTGLSDFQSRAKSTLSGGNDLIAKPYVFVELSVKALTFVFKSYLHKHGLL